MREFNISVRHIGGNGVITVKTIARVLQGYWIYKQKLLEISSSFLCSATGNRTPVYGVRGRCPRPLDDSTVTVCRTSFSKASAKVLLFFHSTKYFAKKMQKKCKFYV